MKSKDDTLTEKANAAFQQAAAKVIERARQTGTPVIVWEKGQIIERSVRGTGSKLLQRNHGSQETSRTEKSQKSG